MTDVAGRNIAADYLRVVSILYIVGIWHLFGEYGHPADWLFKNRPAEHITVLSLATFCLLSGFFLAGHRISSLADARQFYASRFLAIYGPLVLASLLFLIVGLSHSNATIKGMFLIGMLYEPSAHTLWFANMIVLFYLLAPALIALCRRTSAFLALCGLVLLVLGTFEYATGWLDARLILYFPVFAAGILLGGRNLLTDMRTSLAAAALAVIGICISAGVDVSAIEFDLRLIPWAVGSAVCIASVTFTIGGNWKGTKLLAFLAEASFFIYLLHRPIYKIVTRQIPLQSPWAITAELVLFALPLTIALAWLAQKTYTRLLERVAGVVGKESLKSRRRQLP
jgi:peptidoglycan/LPS O-acetylase OafA/YrhL